jgi:DNA/RNA endonuclease G (NUC1)
MRGLWGYSILVVLFLCFIFVVAVKNNDVFKTEEILAPALSKLFKSCSGNPNLILLGPKDGLAYVSCYDFDLAAPRWTAHVLFSNRLRNVDRTSSAWKGTNLNSF